MLFFFYLPGGVGHHVEGHEKVSTCHALRRACEALYILCDYLGWGVTPNHLEGVSSQFIRHIVGRGVSTHPLKKKLDILQSSLTVSAARADARG